MTKIDEIRNAFSKGNVVIDEKGIAIIYTQNDRWITQEFDPKYQAVFADLLKHSDGLIINHQKDKSARFRFCINLENQNPVVFSALKEEMSLEQLDKIVELSMKESMAKKNQDKFFEFFIGTDINDQDIFIEKLAEWTEIIDEANRTNVKSLSAVIRWKEILKKATLLAGFLGCEYEILDNNKDYDGSIALFLPEDAQKTIKILKKKKELFIELLEISIATCIEISIKDNYIS